MKTRILFLMLFIANYSFSQSINDYKAVIIPIKYDFQKSENQYRLQTMTKFNLEKGGMTGFYANQSIPAEYNDRCSMLYIDVVEEKAFLVTKLLVLFKNCNGSVIYQSPAGRSKAKEFESAFSEALNEAFIPVYALEYKYNGGNINTSSIVTSNSPSSTGVVASSTIPAPVPVVNIPLNTANKTNAESNLNVLYAQPTSYGYQLIDNEPKVIMKVYKTSNPSSYMAKKENIQGMLISKENQWFFEYYQNDQLISEKLEIKF